MILWRSWWIAVGNSKNHMKLKYKIIIFILIVVVLAAGGYWLVDSKNLQGEPSEKSGLKVDELAKCLNQKGVVMYGAYWCPHCQRQKRLFGDSFNYVNYVECTKDVKKCQEKKIEGYPTWIFKDGDRIVREATFAELAEKTSCKVP